MTSDIDAPSGVGVASPNRGTCRAIPGAFALPTTRSPELSSCAVPESRNNPSSSAVHVGGVGAPRRAAEVGGGPRAGRDGDVGAGDVAVGGVAGQSLDRAAIAVVGAAGRAALGGVA